MVNLLEVIYLLLYSVTALYGKFIVGNLLQVKYYWLYSKSIVW